MLEYEGRDLRIYVRLTRIEDRTRVDGWVVPVRTLTVQLRADGEDEPLQTEIDEFGRFEFPQRHARPLPPDLPRRVRWLRPSAGHPALLDLRSHELHHAARASVPAQPHHQAVRALDHRASRSCRRARCSTWSRAAFLDPGTALAVNGVRAAQHGLRRPASDRVGDPGRRRGDQPAADRRRRTGLGRPRCTPTTSTSCAAGGDERGRPGRRAPRADRPRREGHAWRPTAGCCCRTRGRRTASRR